MRKTELPRSILLILLTKPSEILISSPLVTALKNTYPNSKIHYLTTHRFRELALGIKGVDKVIYYGDKKTPKTKKIDITYRELKDSYLQLSNTHYELCIDLESNLLSGLLAIASRATTKIGLASNNSNSLFMNKVISRPSSSSKQIGSDYRYLLDQLGTPFKKWRMQVHRGDPYSAREHAGLKTGERYAVISLGANNTQKSWSAQNWQQIALRIRGRYQLRCVIIDFEENMDHCNEIAKNCGALNISTLTSFSETNEILKNASIVIGTDNYFTHAAIALKTPTLALFGPTSPYTFTESEQCKVIYKHKSCSPCGEKPTCNGRYECMKEISPDNVLTEIKPLIERNKMIKAA